MQNNEKRVPWLVFFVKDLGQEVLYTIVDKMVRYKHWNLVAIGRSE